MADKKRAIVALGSNIEPRRVYLAKAIEALSALPATQFESSSSIIETVGVDVPEKFAEQKFLNAVAVFSTGLKAAEFSRLMHKIEDDLGRERTIPNGPRTIDIDLIDFNGEISKTPELILPHPRAKERFFVMEPLAELGITL